MKRVADMDLFFEKYMGNLFRRIIEEGNRKDIKVVVEFAPGFRAKGAYALREIGFVGTVYIIDINKKVLEYVEELYKLVLPDSEIIGLNYSLGDCIKYLPAEIDIFLTNHPLDDMIIFEYLGDKSDNAFNNDEKSKEFLYKAWDEILASSDLNKFKRNVIREWKQFIDNISIGMFILSQYKSAYYSNSDNMIEDYVKLVFLELREIIGFDENLIKSALEDVDPLLDDEFKVSDNIQNSENWIVIQNV